MTANLQSDRVTGLLATCIRAAVRQQYGRELPVSDALDLARVHDFRSALKAVSDQMEVHRNLPGEEKQFRIAVQEAKLITPAGSDAIVRVREKTLESIAADQSSMSGRRVLVNELLSIRYESRAWAHDYGRFMDEIANLNKETTSRIERLRLDDRARRNALNELESILAKAIVRAAGAHYE